MALVGSIATQLKKTVKPSNAGNCPSTPEETLKRKEKLLGILDKATDQFLKNVEAGTVTLNTTADLDRLVKLTLLVSGEPDTIKGTQGSEETTETTSMAVNTNIDKLTSILDINNPEVKGLYDQLFGTLNEANDKYE